MSNIFEKILQAARAGKPISQEQAREQLLGEVQQIKGWQTGINTLRQYLRNETINDIDQFGQYLFEQRRNNPQPVRQADYPLGHLLKVVDQALDYHEIDAADHFFVKDVDRAGFEPTSRQVDRLNQIGGKLSKAEYRL